MFDPIIDLSGYSITIKAFLDLPTASITPANSKLRVYFENSSTGGTPFKQLNFTLGQEWETFTFDFDGTDIPQEIIDAGGYNFIKIGFATGSQTLPAMTYYIDARSSCKANSIKHYNCNPESLYRWFCKWSLYGTNKI